MIKDAALKFSELSAPNTSFAEKQGGRTGRVSWRTAGRTSAHGDIYDDFPLTWARGGSVRTAAATWHLIPAPRLALRRPASPRFAQLHFTALRLTSPCVVSLRPDLSRFAPLCPTLSRSVPLHLALPHLPRFAPFHPTLSHLTYFRSISPLSVPFHPSPSHFIPIHPTSSRSVRFLLALLNLAQLCPTLPLSIPLRPAVHRATRAIQPRPAKRRDALDDASQSSWHFLSSPKRLQLKRFNPVSSTGLKLIRIGYWGSSHFFPSRRGQYLCCDRRLFAIPVAGEVSALIVQIGLQPKTCGSDVTLIFLCAATRWFLLKVSYWTL